MEKINEHTELELSVAHEVANQIALPVLRSMYTASRTEFYELLKSTYLAGVRFGKKQVKT